jgi:hypothetical protein
VSNKKTEKSPYVKYSIQDVAAAEAGHYVIQVGSDLFSYNGKMAFNRDRADKLYADILAGLNDMKENGSDLEKEDASKCLVTLMIHPLRIH